MEWAISQHTHAQQIANHWRGARMGIKSNSLMSSESPWLINLEQFSNVTFSIGTRQLNAMISLEHEQKQKRRQTNKNKAAERHTPSILTDYQFLEAFKSFVCVRAHAHLLIHSFTHKEIVKHKKWKLSKFGCIYCLFLFIFFSKKEKNWMKNVSQSIWMVIFLMHRMDILPYVRCWSVTHSNFF